MLSQKLGFQFIDTVSIYRAVTLLALEQKVDFKDIKGLVRIFKSLDLKFISKPLGNGETHEKIINHGQDITEKLHSVEVSSSVAKVAPHKEVRDVTRVIQRKVGEMQDTVMAGRDIGSVIYPDSKLKFYLDANVKVRAERRFEQLQEKGTDITFEEVLKQMEERDRLDTQRHESPLVIPEGAIVIDTSNLTVEETVDKMIEDYKKVYQV